MNFLANVDIAAFAVRSMVPERSRRYQFISLLCINRTSELLLQNIPSKRHKLRHLPKSIISRCRMSMRVIRFPQSPLRYFTCRNRKGLRRQQFLQRSLHASGWHWVITIDPSFSFILPNGRGNLIPVWTSLISRKICCCGAPVLCLTRIVLIG